MRVLITGDFAITQPRNFFFQFDRSVVELFATSDLNIINLEAPITESTKKILKTGPNLKSEKISTLSALKELNIDIVTLANNHILDFDEQGVIDTLNFCNENSIKTVGAGKNLNEASKTLFTDTVEGKIAIVNFAENEWASATENTAGSNPMDIIENARQIHEAKKQADYVFVIIHGGHEYYNYPSPRMQKQYRFYADQGADIIIGHHSHCISGYEFHNRVPIYYSLGNFLFTLNSQNEDWYTGLVLSMQIQEGKIISKLQPLRQQKTSFNLSLLQDTEEQDVLKNIEAFNEIIEDNEELRNVWNQYTYNQQKVYSSYWSPLTFINNYYLKAALQKIGIYSINNRKAIALYLNLMRCEVHRDLSIEILKNKLLK